MSGSGRKTLRIRSFIPMIIGICPLVGCGAPEEGLARQTEQYQVIDEGAVSGVTSTIQAPGDQVPISAPTPELTDTNLDTTTAFTILDPRVTTAPPAGFDPATPGLAQPPAGDPRAPARTTSPSVDRPASTPAPAPRRTSTPIPSPAPTSVPSPPPAATPSPTQAPAEEPPSSPPPSETPEPDPTPPGSESEADISPADPDSEDPDYHRALTVGG